MDNKQIDELINKALADEQALPEGLSDRLEMYIDTLSDSGVRRKPRTSSFKRTLYWLSGSAASVFLAIGLFWLADTQQSSRLADTYSDPREAAIVAQQALALMSTNLNKGLNQIDEAGQEVTKINKILNKHIKDE